MAIPAQQPVRPEPLSYPCHRAASPVHIDGRLNDPAWQAAPWTPNFVDIEGDAKPKPRFRTRAKLLWDDQYLYIAAELEEPNVKATLTQHDSVIFHDNDFEVFLKPPLAAPGYFEFEINALNTSWDLYLPKRYLDGGKADDSWDIPGLKTAVAINGTLNNPRDTDRNWTVEIAFPWSAYTSRLPVSPPRAGDAWRLNFSRVEWKPGIKKEDNWVWTPQGVVNMHVPESLGNPPLRALKAKARRRDAEPLADERLSRRHPQRILPRIDHYLDAPILLIAERLVHRRGLLDPDAVRDQEAWIDLAIFHPLQQRSQVLVHVCLAHLHGHPLAKGGPEVHLIEHPAIHPRNRQAPTLAHRLDRLPQHERTIPSPASAPASPCRRAPPLSEEWASIPTAIDAAIRPNTSRQVRAAPPPP